MMKQDVVMDLIVSHFEIFACTLLDKSNVIVKAHLDESKTYIFLSPFFKYISGLKVLFNIKLWNFHPDLCFTEI